MNIEQALSAAASWHAYASTLEGQPRHDALSTAAQWDAFAAYLQSQSLPPQAPQPPDWSSSAPSSAPSYAPVPSQGQFRTAFLVRELAPVSIDPQTGQQYYEPQSGAQPNVSQPGLPSFDPAPCGQPTGPQQFGPPQPQMQTPAQSQPDPPAPQMFPTYGVRPKRSWVGFTLSAFIIAATVIMLVIKLNGLNH